MEQDCKHEKTSVIVWNTNALNQSRSPATMALVTGDRDNKQEAVDSRDSSEDAELDEGDSRKTNVIGSPDWQQRKMRLLKPWPVPKLHIEPYSEESLQGNNSDVMEDRNSLSPVIPHLLDKARSCSTSSCSTDSTDLGSQESPMPQEAEESRRDGKDVFYKKKLRARYLSSQSSEDSEADTNRQPTATCVSAAVQREEFKLRSKSADYYESPVKSRPILQRQSQSLSTISEGGCNNLLQWWTNHGSVAAEKQLSDGVHIKQEPYSPRHSPMLLSRHSLESLSDAPDVFSPLTPQSFSLPLQFDGDGGVFRFPGDGARQFTPPRSPRSPRYIPDSRLECLSEQLPLQANSTNTLSIPSPASPNKSPSNMKEYHPQNVFTFSPLVIPPGEGSHKTLPRTPTSGFPLGLQDNPSTYPPKYLFSPQLYNDLAEAQRHRHNNNNNNNSNGTGGKMDNTFICPICGQIFSSFDNLAKHMAKHLPTETVRSGNNNKIHYCKVCNRAFARSDMLTRHMRLHTGLKPYECQVCGQVFSRSDHLNTHQRTHTGEKPYKCPQCPYAACRRDMITRHMRIHSKQWPRRGGLKNVSKDDIRKCSLSSVDSMESADTGHGNMSVSSLDSVDLEKDSRMGSYGSSDSLESDLSGRSLSGDGSVDLAGASHNWPVDGRLQQGERSPKRSREDRVTSGDNKSNIFLQIPGRSTSSSTVDSDDVPSPRPSIWSPAGSLDEQLLLGLPKSPVPRRANSEESQTHEGVSPILTARGGSENVSAPPSGDEGREAFLQHRNNRTISLESDYLGDPTISRNFSMRRSGLKKQRNISCTSIDSVDSSFMDEGSVKSENSVSFDETAFLKCTVSPSAKENDVGWPS